MDFSEKWGTDVETAVALALDDLKLSRDDVDVIVLEEPSRGFFGIGSKLAKVRVQKKEYLLKAEREKEKEEQKAAVLEKYAKKASKGRRENGFSEKREHNRRDRSKNEAKKDTENAENTVVEAAVSEASADVQAAPAKKDKPHRQRRGKRGDKAPKNVEEVSFEGEFEDFASAVVSREPEENLTLCESHPALSFLKEVTAEMGLDLEITVKTGTDSVYADITGKDSGTIIGKRGQTLDAIQYLTSLVVNKDQSKYIRVVVDAENYRAKREQTLEQLAKRLAAKVVKSGKSLRLEPMNPYERKVIHATLQNHPSVITRSEGQDPYRRVIIELK